MNILVTSNDKYAFPAKVLLNSLCSNNDVDVTVYFMYSQLSHDNIKLIKELEIKYRKLSIHFLKVKEELFSTAPIKAITNTYITIETYFRLAAGDLLPTNVDRLLYLDTDIVVNGNLENFYNHSFDKNTLALVCEDYGLRIAKKIRVKVYDNLNLNSNHRYFNAGVMLLNMNRIRELYKFDDYIRFIEQNHDKLIFHDQDVLNKMYEGMVDYEDYKKYNCRPFFFPFSKKYEALISDAKIIHYGEKPWNANFTDLGGEIFWKYAQFDRDKQSEFKEENNKFLNSHIISIVIKRIKRNVKLTVMSHVLAHL